MANINVTWTPASGATGQRIFAKIRTSPTWLSSSFSPANDLTGTASTAVYQAATVNIVSQFKINTICTGASLSTDSLMGEGINFGCLTATISGNTSSSFTASLTGVPTDISSVSFTVYANDGVTLIANMDVANIGGSPSNTFTGLVSGTTYKVTTTLHAVLTNNGVSTGVTQVGTCGQATATTTASSFTSDVFITNSSTALQNGRFLSGDVDAYNITGGTLPVTNGNSTTSSISVPTNPYTGTLTLNLDGDMGRIRVIDSAGTIQCQNYAGAGTYSFPSFVISSAAAPSITLDQILC